MNVLTVTSKNHSQLEGSTLVLMVSASANDSYRILGISQGASPDEIKNAYRITVVIHQE